LMDRDKFITLDFLLNFVPGFDTVLAF
jgi:hypothetical protein